MTTYRIKGIEQITNALLQFPMELQKRSVSNALRLAAEPIKRQAIALAPIDTGNLKVNVISLRDKNPNLSGLDFRQVIMVAYGRRKYANTEKNKRLKRVGKAYGNKSGAFYWRYLEFGTSKIGPKPFMRPAFETKKQEALAIAIASLVSDVQKIAKKLKG